MLLPECANLFIFGSVGVSTKFIIFHIMYVPASIPDFLIVFNFLVVICPSGSIKSIHYCFSVELIIPELLYFFISFPTIMLFLVEVVPVDVGTDF